MEAFYLYLNQLFNTNRQTFVGLPPVNWLNAYKADYFLERRQKLLPAHDSEWMFKNTKPFHKAISPGCKLCGEGRWSCLFITNKCNAGCFYCPASQTQDSVPSSQQLTFESPEAYSEYVRYFGFEGVSFSGGEPLLFFERTLNYLKSVRQSAKPETYIWIYTNGILAERSLFGRLAAAGLDEVRFDIGATNYSLDKIEQAKGIIPNITIEIPAVPEEVARLKKLLPEMIQKGVSYLNLHQLRLTNHNARHLLKRNYTYLPSERPVVIESELAALDIMNYARSHDLEIGVNYCAFDYKNRFQKAGYRRQIAEALGADQESITQNGYLRRRSDQGLAYDTYNITDSCEEGDALTLNHKKYALAKKQVMPMLKLTKEQKVALEMLLHDEPAVPPSSDFLFRLWQREYIERGLRDY